MREKVKELNKRRIKKDELVKTNEVLEYRLKDIESSSPRYLKKNIIRSNESMIKL